MSELTATREQLEDEIRSLRLRLAETEAALAGVRPAPPDDEDRFRKIFDHSNDAIFLVDPEQDEILDVNARACQMLGYSREELLSLPMSVIHPHDMARVRAFSESVFEHGEGWTDELSCFTKAGRIVPAEISGSIIELGGRNCMIAMVRDVSARNQLEQEKRYLHDELRAGLGFGEIVGRSAALRRVLNQVEMVAPTGASVLITGESGVGKELVARAIHERSERSQRELVRVNCASIPAELFESEFFGHVKGAFTSAERNRQGRFELADGGTLFLDEVGEIPLSLQSKLLRVLQEGRFERVGESFTRQVDARIVAASNRELEAEAREQRFRQDLFYRLSVFPIHIPPLRERPEDVAPLAEHFLAQGSERLGVPRPRLTRTDLLILERNPWPGNARELRNVIERALILAGGGERLHLEDGVAGPAAPGRPPPAAAPWSAADLTLADLKRLEREVILGALEAAEWKIYGPGGAAERLEIKPTTLASRMKKMGLEKPRNG